MRKKTVVWLIPGTAMGLVVILFWSLNIWSVKAAPTTRYVALQSACGTQTPCYPDIQSALDDSDPGDEVLVAGGTYTGVKAIYPIIGAGYVYTQGIFIDKDIIIRGGFTTTTWASPDPVAYPSVIDALELGRVVYITSGITVTLEGLNFINGRALGTLPGYLVEGGGLLVKSANLTISNCQVLDSTGWGGGGIFNSGSITLTNSIISENYSVAPLCCSSGGGINNAGELRIINSTVTGNTADAAGGIGNSGTLQVVNSTIKDNSGENYSKGLGGGIGNSGSAEIYNSAVLNNSSLHGGGIQNIGTISITNSTMSGNWATAGSVAGLANSGGTVTLTNVTIVSNTSTIAGMDIGSGIDNDDSGGTVSVVNSIIANNSAENCGGLIHSLGHNLEDSNWCGLSATGDMTDTHPILDALDYYAGPTLSFGLLPDSPAIDAGDNAVCPPYDQRGVGRPIDGDDDAVADCDIGSFEYQPPAPTPEPTSIPPVPLLYTYLPLLSR
jgi:hypothetical protein